MHVYFLWFRENFVMISVMVHELSCWQRNSHKVTTEHSTYCSHMLHCVVKNMFLHQCVGGLTDAAGDINTRSFLTLHGFAVERLRRVSVADHGSTDCNHHQRPISLWHWWQVVQFQFQLITLLKSLVIIQSRTVYLCSRINDFWVFSQTSEKTVMKSAVRREGCSMWPGPTQQSLVDRS